MLLFRSRHTKIADLVTRFLVNKADIMDHPSALQLVLHYVKETFSQKIEKEVVAVGHRVVHGKIIDSAQLVTPAVETAIEDAAEFAP